MKNIKTEEAKLREEIEKFENYQKEYHILLNREHKKSEMKKVSLRCVEAGNKLPLLQAKLNQLLADKKMFQDAVKESREKLADLEHQQWEKWSRYVAEHNDIPTNLLQKWGKNWKPYFKLDEKTKDSDRIWADKIIKELLKTIGVEE